MNSPSCFRFLGPYSQRLNRSLSASKQVGYLQFYAAVRRFRSSAPRWSGSTSCNTPHINVESGISQYGVLQNPVESGYKSQRDDVRRRIGELQNAKALKYPRIKRDVKAMSCADFRELFNSLKPEEVKNREIVTLRGMFLDTPQKLISKNNRKVVLFANSGIKARVHGCCARWL
jgi:hypothetical protein